MDDFNGPSSISPLSECLRGDEDQRSSAATVVKVARILCLNIQSTSFRFIAGRIGGASNDYRLDSGRPSQSDNNRGRNSVKNNESKDGEGRIENSYKSSTI